MSNRPENAEMVDPSTGLPVYGMDLEIKRKIMGKRDVTKEAEVRDWIQDVTGEKYSHPDDIQASLKDGILLCKLANKILPGSVSSIATQKMPFMQMGNVNSFLTAIQKIGVKKSDLFVVIDLYEGKNIPVVVECLYSLGGVCMTNKWKGPLIGVKRSEKKEINFTDEQIRTGQNTLTQISVGSEKVNIGRDTSRDVVKTTEKSTSGEGTHWTGGSNKVVMDRDTSRDVVKTTTKSVNQESTQWTGGSNKVNHDRDTSHDVVKSTPTIKSSGGGSDDDMALLEKLNQLKLSGVITEEEFKAKKKKILGL
jgi:hypothetical protein